MKSVYKIGGMPEFLNEAINWQSVSTVLQILLTHSLTHLSNFLIQSFSAECIPDARAFDLPPPCRTKVMEQSPLISQKNP
jgi:hypothetical protein